MERTVHTSNAMSIASAIIMYEELLRKKRLIKYGAGYERLQQLKTRYSSGERYFSRYYKK